MNTAEALRRRTGDVQARAQAVVTRNEEVRQDAWRARLRARATRDWAQALRGSKGQGAREWLDPHPVEWFSVEGTLGGEAVWARWERGRLTCSPDLRAHAQLVVDVGTVFVNDDPPARVPATLSGPPASVMLTLAQACDSVINIDYELLPPTA